MTSGFPIVTCSVSSKISATHSLPSIGFGDPHEHDYEIRAGWTLEINPYMGCTKSMQEMRRGLVEITDKIHGRNLNELFSPHPPTAETLACWVMARLPAYWDFVEVRCYGDFVVRVQANAMRGEWTKKYRSAGNFA